MDKPGIAVIESSAKSPNTGNGNAHFIHDENLNCRYTTMHESLAPRCFHNQGVAVRIDLIDRRILDVLQEDAAAPIADIAARVGLSAAPCWRRIRKLEEYGLIDRRVALLDRRRANLPMTVFVTVRTAEHSVAWLERFRTAIADIGEIVEAWRLTGRDDYLLKLVVPNVDVYDGVYKRLIERVEFLDVSSSIAMEEMKFTTAIPTKYI